MTYLAPVAPPVAPVVEEPAVAPPVAPVEDTRTAAEVQTAIDSLRNKQRGLLLKNGKVPMPNLAPMLLCSRDSMGG